MIKLGKIINEAYDKSEDYITDGDVMNGKIKNINGFELDYDGMTGSVGWYSKKLDRGLWATPNWDGNMGQIPFDDDDGNHFGTLDFSKSKYKGNKPLQLKLYYEAVKNATKKIK